MAAQAMPRQSASRYLMQVLEAIEAFVAKLSLCRGKAQVRQLWVKFLVEGGSPTAHPRWGQRSIHGGQGASMLECGSSLAEQACRTPAMGVADYVSSTFAQDLGGSPLLCPGLI